MLSCAWDIMAKKDCAQIELEPGVSAVVPVYRSEETLLALYHRLVKALAKCASGFEIIFVEDGGYDGSWEVIEGLAKTDCRVVGVRLSRNYGQHNALLCGIRMARFSVVVTLDDDLQNPPEEIGKLLAKLEEGYDVVYGCPEREQHNFWRDQASRITKIVLQGTMGAETACRISAFRVFRTILRDAFYSFRSPFVSIDVLFTWGTTRFTHTTVHHEPRLRGKSNYSFMKLVSHAMNMMTGFSTLPLQFASLVGFSFTLIGFVFLLYVIGRYLVEGGSVPGFPFLASMIAIFSGAQLFSIGIIGEYLARMHFRAMEQPTYSISTTTSRPTA